ncbi:hypothetical protein ACHWQZ_G010910 [Mnemiopsis leidyi]
MCTAGRGPYFPKAFRNAALVVLVEADNSESFEALKRVPSRNLRGYGKVLVKLSRERKSDMSEGGGTSIKDRPSDIADLLEGPAPPAPSPSRPPIKENKPLTPSSKNPLSSPSADTPPPPPASDLPTTSLQEETAPIKIINVKRKRSDDAAKVKVVSNDVLTLKVTDANRSLVESDNIDGFTLYSSRYLSDLSKKLTTINEEVPSGKDRSFCELLGSQEDDPIEGSSVDERGSTSDVGNLVISSNTAVDDMSQHEESCITLRNLGDETRGSMDKDSFSCSNDTENVKYKVFILSYKGRYKAARFESVQDFKTNVFKTFDLDDKRCYSFSGKLIHLDFVYSLSPWPYNFISNFEQ